MTWWRRIIRRNPAVAPRTDPPSHLAEAERALREAQDLARRVRAQEPAVRAIMRELASHREANHIPDRVAAMIRQGRSRA
jgi:hypothetical protein